MKGQAAMEYLMTYGWALIVVAAAIVVLYGYTAGWFGGGGGNPCNPCFSPGAALTYVDHTGDVLVVRAGPARISNVSLYANGYHFTTTSPDTTTTPVSSSDITITATGNLTGDVDITVEYQDYNSRLYHNITATLHGA